MARTLDILLTGDRGVSEALALLWHAKAPPDSRVKCRYARPARIPLWWRAKKADVIVAVMLAGSPALVEQVAGTGRPVVLLWIGTDVHDFITRAELAAHTERLRRSVTVHAAVAPHLVDELSTLGIEAELWPLVPPDLTPVRRPVPQRHRVLFYSTPGRETFYGAPVFVELARRFPDAEFIAVGGGQPAETAGSGAKLPNLQFAGRVTPDDLARLYAGTTLLIRPAHHDGLPKMALEALRYGTHVVTPVEIPGCTVAKGFEASVATAARILSAPPSLNPDAQLGLDQYDPARWAAVELKRLRELAAKRAE